MNSQKIDVYLDDGGAFPAGLDMVMILSSAERRVLCTAVKFSGDECNVDC